MNTSVDSANKTHVSVCVAGQVDSGKSSLVGRLIFELGGINEREMQKLRDEAAALNKSSFAFAFYMDRQKEERERGVTIATTTKEFYTNSYHYTVLDCPGHKDYIKNMITGSSQADVALLLIPADGNFTSAIAKGNHKSGEHQGQSRHHSLLLNLLGVKQLIVGINKMDADIANYTQERYQEVSQETKRMLQQTGWKKDFIEKSVPIIPFSAWHGENLIKQSEKMSWWKGVELQTVKGKTVHVHTIYDALEKLVEVPDRLVDAPMRTPISGVHKIKGVGDVLTGRIEQGVVKPNDEVIFLPTHSDTLPCTGKVFTVEMHHRSVPQGGPGDNVGLNIKNLNKDNMPRVGDIMILKSDQSLRRCKSFVAQVQVLDHPGELKVGYTPICFVRTSRAAVKITKLDWKVGKETGRKKLENPTYLKSGDMAQVVFEPRQPFTIDSFNNCNGLGRLAIMEGKSVVMLGRAMSVEFY